MHEASVCGDVFYRKKRFWLYISDDFICWSPTNLVLSIICLGFLYVVIVCSFSFLFVRSRIYRLPRQNVLIFIEIRKFPT